MEEIRVRIETLIDEILDKTLKYGIISLTNPEINFLDSLSTESKEVIEERYNILISGVVFDSDIFRFELIDVKKEKTNYSIQGNLYTPNFLDISGSFTGNILVYKNKSYHLDFYKVIANGKKETEYSAIDFSKGFESELDDFIIMIIKEVI